MVNRWGNKSNQQKMIADETTLTASDTDTTCCNDDDFTNKKSTLTCKLTTSELRQRKATVILSLKKQIIEKKELKKGYSYKFSGTDKMVDELVEFVKTERECCDFFVFNLSVKGDKSEAWLRIAGPTGAKDFIKTELQM